MLNHFKSACALTAFCFFGLVEAQEFKDKAIAYTYPGYALNLNTGDVNGDGHSDLVVASSFTQDDVSLMINNGEGGYDFQHFADVDWPDALFGDMDGDGDQDIVVLEKAEKKIGWYRNHGNGNFLPMQYNYVASNLLDVRHMQLLDFDFDGDTDIIFHYSALGPDKAVVKVNNGTGTFSTISGTASSGIIRSIAAGDMDGDGDMDLFCGKSGDVVWFENLDNTGFGPEILLSDDLNAEYVIAVHLLDYDKDGDADPFFGAINYSGGQVSTTEVGMFESYTEGQFSDKVILAENTFNQGEIISTDMDNDGDMDILTSSDVSGSVLWYENTGCDFQEHTIPTALSRYTAIETTDINNDGNIDVLVNGSPKRITLFTNQGGGTFEESIVSENGGTELPFALHTSDMDNDGDLDLLSTSLDDNKIAWYENLGNKTFSYQRIISTQVDEPKSVATADFDGDGDMDVVSAYATGNSIKWFKQEADMTFVEGSSIGGNVDDATSVYAADLNGDGHVDILSASYEDKKIAWYDNLGNGSFGWQNVLSVTADGAQVVLAADLDNDNLLDVLYASINDHTIAWFENNGNSTFNNIVNVVTDSNTFVTWIDVMDVENDGDLDIISCSALEGVIYWYENDGTGNFGSPQVIDANEDYGLVSLSDLDLDGDLDILATKLFDDEIVWFENTGSGTFGNPIQIASEIEAPRHVIGVDVDADGDADVVTSGYIDEELFISENLFNTQTNISSTVCDTLLSPDGNTVYTESGVYLDTLQSTDGGDSVIVTTLYVVEEDTTTLDQILCFGDTFYIENTMYTESGSYTQILSNQCGLDSTILLNLSVLTPDTTMLTDTICANECFRVGNANYTSTGSYIDTLTNQCGFDSIVFTSLFVYESSEDDLQETLCGGDTLVIGGEQYYSPGEYDIYLENGFGCDSIIHLDLSVVTINNHVNVSGTTLTAADPTADAYQWVDCNDNDVPIPGATGSTYTATANGSYAVILTFDGCDKRSQCKTIQGIGLDENTSVELNMYPNPTHNTVQIQFNQDITSAEITVTDMVGKQHMVKSVENTNLAVLNLESLEDGVYMINCNINNTYITVKRVVKKSK